MAYRQEEIAMVMVNEMSRRSDDVQNEKRQWYAEKCNFCGSWHVRELLSGIYLATR